MVRTVNEHSFVQSVHRQLKKHSDIFLWKINDRFAGGTPDAFIEGPKGDLWVEYKFLKPFPKRDDTLIDLTQVKYLSKNQQHWLKRRERIRKDTLVVVGSDHGSCVFFENEWESPLTAGEFRQKSMQLRDLVNTILRRIKC